MCKQIIYAVTNTTSLFAKNYFKLFRFRSPWTAIYIRTSKAIYLNWLSGLIFTRTVSKMFPLLSRRNGKTSFKDFIFRYYTLPGISKIIKNFPIKVIYKWDIFDYRDVLFKSSNTIAGAPSWRSNIISTCTAKTSHLQPISTC